MSDAATIRTCDDGRQGGAMWTCEACNRTFGRKGQGHLCIPGTTIDDWFADEPPEHLEIHRAIVDHLSEIADVHVEAVAVGIFYKRRSTFAQLRPRYDHLALSMVLPRRLDSDRVTRRTKMPGGRFSNAAPIRMVDDLDGQILQWLTESCLAAAP